MSFIVKQIASRRVSSMTHRDNQQIGLTSTCLTSSKILLGASCRDGDCEAKRGALRTCVTSSVIWWQQSRRGNGNDRNVEKADRAIFPSFKIRWNLDFWWSSNVSRAQPIFIAIVRFHHRSCELPSAQDRFDGTLMKETMVSAVISAPSVVVPRE